MSLCLLTLGGGTRGEAAADGYPTKSPSPQSTSRGGPRNGADSQPASKPASQPASRPAQASSPFKTQMSQEPEPALETRSPDLNRQQPELEPKLPQAGCIDIGHKPHT